MPRDEVSRKIAIKERKLGRERAFGLAWLKKRLVELDPRQPSKERLDTVIHETLHILYPEWSESKVRSTSRKLSRIVWRDGYRRVYLNEKKWIPGKPKENRS